VIRLADSPVCIDRDGGVIVLVDPAAATLLLSLTTSQARDIAHTLLALAAGMPVIDGAALFKASDHPGADQPTWRT
jgi:hypothetical protein